jgi:O-antigen/teichoic acid export membrane protein
LNMIGLNYMLLPLVAFYSPFVLFTNYHLRHNSLGRVSLGRMLYYGGGGTLQVLGGWLFGGRETIYLTAQTIAAFLAFMSLFPIRQSWSWLMQQSRDLSHTASEVRRVAAAYSKFPRYQTLAQLLAAVSVNMTTFFMRVAFSADWAGWYFIAWRILAAPTTLVSQAVGQVFYRDAAEKERKGQNQGRSVENMVYGLIRISILPALALGVLAPRLVRFALGSEWVAVGSILQALLVAFLVAFFTSPISNLLNVKDKQEKVLFYYTLLFLVRATALGIGWFLHMDLGSVWIYSLASAAVLLPFSANVIHALGGHHQVVLRKLIPSFADAGVVLLALATLWYFDFLDSPVGLVTSAILLLLAAWREITRGGWGLRGYPSPHLVDNSPN